MFLNRHTHIITVNKRAWSPGLYIVAFSVFNCLLSERRKLHAFRRWLAYRTNYVCNHSDGHFLNYLMDIELLLLTIGILDTNWISCYCYCLQRGYKNIIPIIEANKNYLYSETHRFAIQFQ